MELLTVGMSVKYPASQQWLLSVVSWGGPLVRNLDRHRASGILVEHQNWNE